MSQEHSKTELDLEKLLLIAAGHTAFQLMWAGIELGLYDLLSKEPNCHFDRIADSLKLNHQPTRILLTGLTALGILEKSGQHYANAKLTEQKLVSSAPNTMAPIFGWQRYIVYEGLVDFVESLKQDTNVGLERFPGPGHTLYERLTNDAFKEKKFQDAMSALSSQANHCLLDFADLANIQHIVDAGGGDGTNGIALCNKFTNLSVSIFDSDSVCKIARKNIENHGLSERIHTWPGNFLHDPFPGNIDAVLYSHIMTIWSPATNVALLKRTYEALPSDGKVIIFNMMGNNDDDGPISTALGSPYFQAIATGNGMLYSWTDYTDWLKEAGFTKIERFEELPLDHGILVGKK